MMTHPSLKCGHSFCKDCLQSWFLTKFESKCEEYKIKLTDPQFLYIYAPSTSTASEAERNMLKFSRLSNRINPEYICPSCRDPLLPSLRNSFLDFKLDVSISTLNTLIGYVPTSTAGSAPGWKQANVDILAFLNSRLFQRSVEDYSADNFEAEIVDIDIDWDPNM